jgi:hypothetical protein
VRNAILQLRGIDTYQEFVMRHRRAMESGESFDQLQPAGLRGRRSAAAAMRSSHTCAQTGRRAGAVFVEHGVVAVLEQRFFGDFDLLAQHLAAGLGRQAAAENQ